MAIQCKRFLSFSILLHVMKCSLAEPHLLPFRVRQVQDLLPDLYVIHPFKNGFFCKGLCELFSYKNFGCSTERLFNFLWSVEKKTTISTKLPWCGSPSTMMSLKKSSDGKNRWRNRKFQHG